MSNTGGNNDLMDVQIKACFLYSVWLMRNGVAFGGSWTFASVLAKFESSVEEYYATALKMTAKTGAARTETDSF